MVRWFLLFIFTYFYFFFCTDKNLFRHLLFLCNKKITLCIFSCWLSIIYSLVSHTHLLTIVVEHRWNLLLLYFTSPTWVYFSCGISSRLDAYSMHFHCRFLNLFCNMRGYEKKKNNQLVQATHSVDNLISSYVYYESIMLWKHIVLILKNDDFLDVCVYMEWIESWLYSFIHKMYLSQLF